MIGGQVGFAGHLSVADGTKVGAQTGIDTSLKDAGAMYLGTPAMTLKSFYKSHVIFKKLPDMDRQLFDLQKRLEKLESQNQENN